MNPQSNVAFKCHFKRASTRNVKQITVSLTNFVPVAIFKN